jgi:hypothetical protein
MNQNVNVFRKGKWPFALTQIHTRALHNPKGPLGVGLLGSGKVTGHKPEALGSQLRVST